MNSQFRFIKENDERLPIMTTMIIAETAPKANRCGNTEGKSGVTPTKAVNVGAQVIANTDSRTNTSNIK